MVGPVSSLANKTLFITGASRGIGKAIALRAAADGANVVIAAKTAEPHPKLSGTIYTAAAEIEAAGGKLRLKTEAHTIDADRIEGGGWPMSEDAIVRVRDTETGALAAAGISGELEIRAPSRFLGYFHNPQATADAITSDGFFRTGDIGRLRGDGSFVYETRAGDAMRLGGFLVGPGEIEDELNESLIQKLHALAAQRVHGLEEVGGSERDQSPDWSRRCGRAAAGLGPPASGTRWRVRGPAPG